MTSRTLLASMVTTLLLLTLISTLSPHSSVIPTGQAASRTITLDGITFPGWNGTTTTPNPDILVGQGDNITLLLSSGDGSPHRFYVDVNNNANPDCPGEKCSPTFSTQTTFPFDVDFAAGNYTYYCSLHQPSMKGQFVVEGFTLTSNLFSLKIIQGSSNSSIVTVRSINGFTGTVDLTAVVSPTGPTTSYNPANVFLTAGSTATSNLTISTTGSTQLGSYSTSVRGNSSSSYSITSLAAVVVSPDFTISANPNSLEIQLGSSAMSSINLASVDGFSSDIVLSASIDPPSPEISALLTPGTVPLSSGGTGTSSLDVSVSSSATPGTYSISITGISGPITHVTTLTLFAGPDFGLTSNPNSLTLTPGSSGVSTITVSSFNGFAGTVDLSATSSPSGISAGLSPANVNLSSGGAASSTLTASGTSTSPVVNYTVTVTATSNGKTHTATISLNLVDFTITASNTTLTLTDTSTVNVTITISGLNGFSGLVSLASSSSSGTLFTSIDVPTVTLGPGAPGSVILRVGSSTAPDGNYTVTVTGTQGGLSHSTSLSVTVRTSKGPNDVSNFVLAAGVASITALIAVLVYVRTRRQPEPKVP